MMRHLVVDHLARVEGHGGLVVEMEGEVVRRTEFQVTEGLRLVEGMIRGRSYRDVAPIVSRICAICSAAHTITSIKAMEDAFGVEVTPQTVQLRDVMFRGESIESHALHLFLLVLPDYFGYPSAIAMADEHREAVVLGLRLKRLGNAMQEAIGGRAVHPVNAVLGGFGAPPSHANLVALRTQLVEGMADADAAVALLATLPAIPCGEAELPVAALLPPEDAGYGYAAGRSIVVGTGMLRDVVDVSAYRELLSERAVAYSHAKQSRLAHRPFMVGALARLTLHGARLTDRARAVAGRLGLRTPSGNPLHNNAAQAVELALDIELALRTVEQLLDDGLAAERPVAATPRAGVGVGATEAPRGLLIHRYEFARDGTVVAADVVTPTAMNAAALEWHARATAIQHAALDDDTLTRRLEMVVRAYDPCLSCAVHLVRPRA